MELSRIYLFLQAFSWFSSTSVGDPSADYFIIIILAEKQELKPIFKVKNKYFPLFRFICGSLQNIRRLANNSDNFSFSGFNYYSYNIQEPTSISCGKWIKWICFTELRIVSANHVMSSVELSHKLWPVCRHTKEWQILHPSSRINATFKYNFFK